jgi:hypothetical protein
MRKVAKFFSPQKLILPRLKAKMNRLKLHKSSLVRAQEYTKQKRARQTVSIASI